MVKILRYTAIVALLIMSMMTVVSGKGECEQSLVGQTDGECGSSSSEGGSEVECEANEHGGSGLIWTGQYWEGENTCEVRWYCQDNVLWSEYIEGGCDEEVVVESAIPNEGEGDSQCYGYEFKEEYEWVQSFFDRGLSVPYVPGMFKWACYEDSF